MNIVVDINKGKIKFVTTSTVLLGNEIYKQGQFKTVYC